MTVGFGWADFECSRRGGSEEVRFVEKGFGALSDKSGWWRAVSERLWEGRRRGGRVRRLNGCHLAGGFV